MKVRATALGYYGHERRPEGAVFDLEPIKRMRKDKEGRSREVTISAEQQFSERWMERVGVSAKTRVKTQVPRPEVAMSQHKEQPEPAAPVRGKAKPAKVESTEEI